MPASTVTPTAYMMQLNELRILELAHLVPGPFATQLLADAGAEVIKVEPTDGGDSGREFPFPETATPGAIFETLNRGKQSVAIDLKTDAGRTALYRLVADADVILSGYPPAVATRLGADPETLFEHNQNLIYCSLTGYGTKGPYSDRPSHELNYLGLSGLLTASQHDTQPRPPQIGYPIAGLAGGLYAAFAIVAEIATRQQPPSEPVHIDLAIAEAVTTFGWIFTATEQSMTAMNTSGTFLSGTLPWYQIYETADGQYITVAIFEPNYWQQFCEAVDRPALIDAFGSNDVATREALIEELQALFKTRSQAEWQSLADDLGLPIEQVRTLTEGLTHPQLTAREFGPHVDSGRMTLPYQVDGDRPARTDPSPAVGADTRSLLLDAGYTPAEIQRLRADGIIETRQ